MFASSHPEVAFGGQGRRLEKKGKRCVSTSNKTGIEGSVFSFCLFCRSSKLDLFCGMILIIVPGFAYRGARNAGTWLKLLP